MSFAQTERIPDSVKSQIISELISFKKRNRLTSLSFAFFSGDNSSFEFATGYANVGKKRKATADHIYTIASVTKSLTSMTLLDLVFQSYLSLGDSVHKIIQGFPENITVLDLLNHTSGFLREKENEHYLTNSSLTQIVNYLPVKFKLKIHRYANFNYAAIGAVIEKITGKSFAEVAGSYFRSITTENLYFNNNHKSTQNTRFVTNYVRKGRRLLRHNLVNFGIWQPAAFAQTTARALAKFLRYHVTPQFLEFIKSHAVTTRKRTLRNGVKMRECYSLGFRLRYLDDELKYVYHNGFLYGVISTIYYFPQKEAGFVAIANMSSYPHQSIGLGGLYRKIEKILDQNFNTKLAHFTTQNGFAAGVKFYERNSHHGEAREGILTQIATNQLRMNKQEEAISLLQLINHIFPKSGATYQRLSEVYLKNGEDELAEEVLINGIIAEPDTIKSAKMIKRLNSGNGK